MPHAVGPAMFLLAALPLAFGSPDRLAAQGIEHGLDWRPDHPRLLTVPSGRGLGSREARFDLTGIWTPFTTDRALPYESMTLRPSITLGLSDRLAIHAGYWPERIPPEPDPEAERPTIHQDGEIFGGLELSLPWGTRTLSFGGQVTHPLRNEFDRTIGMSVGYGIVHWGRQWGGYTGGLGWRGAPRGRHDSGWDGSWFAVLGAYRALAPNLELVGEGYIREALLGARPGLRTGFGGLSLEGSFGCGVAWGVGMGTVCEGPAVTGSFTIGGW